MAKNEIPPKAPKPQYDAGHVPITEEFDSAKRSLPPAVPVVIALLVVGIVVGGDRFPGTLQAGGAGRHRRGVRQPA